MRSRAQSCSEFALEEAPTPPPSSARLSVLVVEDNQFNQALIKRILAEQNFEVAFLTFDSGPFISFILR